MLYILCKTSSQAYKCNKISWYSKQIPKYPNFLGDLSNIRFLGHQWICAGELSYNIIQLYAPVSLFVFPFISDSIFPVIPLAFNSQYKSPLYLGVQLLNISTPAIHFTHSANSFKHSMGGRQGEVKKIQWKKRILIYKRKKRKITPSNSVKPSWKVPKHLQRSRTTNSISSTRKHIEMVQLIIRFPFCHIVLPQPCTKLRFPRNSARGGVVVISAFSSVFLLTE